MNAMAEVWIGDDWYHNGALRQTMVEYVYDADHVKEADRKLPVRLPRPLPGVPRRRLGRRVRAARAEPIACRPGAGWSSIPPTPTTGELQAVDQALAKATRTVPTLHVHGLFDQEDIYGPILAYGALEQKDTANARNFLVLGPWHHGQQTARGFVAGTAALGLRHRPLLPRARCCNRSGTSTSRGVGPEVARSPVLAFDTGDHRWREYDVWPPPSDEAQALPGSRRAALAFTAPTADRRRADASTAFVSDPAKPVPYRVPPIRPLWAEDSTWRRWLVDDQRPFASRPDVLVFESEPLEEPLILRGEVVADLFASTTGADADWVVKLIDVYPPEVRAQQELGGYQLMVSADIMRGRYHQGFDRPQAVEPGAVVEYRFRMPHASHTFEPGHRIMVQVQSSWFPLYDRNPQTWVENIAFASSRATTARRRTASITRRAAASFIELPVSSLEVAAASTAASARPRMPARCASPPSCSICVSIQRPRSASHSVGRSGRRRWDWAAPRRCSAASRRVRASPASCGSRRRRRR